MQLRRKCRTKSHARPRTNETPLLILLRGAPALACMHVRRELHIRAAATTRDLAASMSMAQARFSKNKNGAACTYVPTVYGGRRKNKITFPRTASRMLSPRLACVLSNMFHIKEVWGRNTAGRERERDVCMCTAAIYWYFIGVFYTSNTLSTSSPRARRFYNRYVAFGPATTSARTSRATRG